MPGLVCVFCSLALSAYIARYGRYLLTHTMTEIPSLLEVESLLACMQALRNLSVTS